MSIPRRRLLLVTVAAALIAGQLSAAVPANAAINPPTWLRTMGFSGHAGVYAWGMATAIDGTILTSDYNNYVVRRYSTSGTQLQTFSGVGSGPCQTFQPYGLAVDPTTGVIYLSDLNNGTIEVFSADGTCTGSINTRPNGGYYMPRMAVNSRGLLYVVNSHNTPGHTNSVLIYNPNGTFNRSVSFGGVSTADGRFNTIRGIAIDATDNVYLNDAGNGRVQVFDANLNYLRKFGQAGSGAGRLGGDLRGMAIDDANGWIYVSDPAQGQVEKFTLSGISLGAATVPAPDGTIGSPREVTVGLDGTLYVADYGNNQVMAFDAALNNTLNIPNPPQPAPNGGLNQPEGVAVRNSDGHVFVTDTFNHRIQEFTSTGTFVRAWGFRGITPDGLSYPRGVAIDQTTGNVWVNNTRSGNIKAFDPQGNFLRVFGSEGSGNGQFYYARGIAFGSGRVYVTDSGNLRLTVLNATTGAVVWSRPCGTRNPTNYVLFGCTSVALDPSGNVYAVAIWERAIYKFSPTGTLLFKRTYPQGSAQGSLNQPYGAAIRGNLLYVSERSNNRISVFDLNGAFQGVFGSTGTGHVQFRQPSAISIDSSGRIYVCETVGERIQVLQLN